LWIVYCTIVTLCYQGHSSTTTEYVDDEWFGEVGEDTSVTPRCI